YQLSGAIVLTVHGQSQTIRTNEGVFIPSGTKLTIRPVDGEPVTYLQFLLSPIAYFYIPDLSNGDARELYRSTSPIPGLREGTYVVDLKRVSLPFQEGPDLPHRRSGAALHFVLSGFGAETGPGSL